MSAVALDATVLDTVRKAPFENYTLREQRVHLFDVTAPGFAAMKTQETHKLVTIPVGKALVGATVIVVDAVASDGNATLQFKIVAGELTTALAKTVFAAGAVVRLNVTSMVGYAKTTPLTVDVTVGTADLTAGKFVLIPEFVDIDAALNRG